ncbi:hypothetical protein F4804DRAFT_301904 [Jackrogersella minutella]|nr:hypothetical protein F4804DRAFT_301904 [Jackrogersella minutella]
MEPPSKRMRLGQAPYDDDDEDEANLDELSMSPTQFDTRQDPMYELDRGRAKAATRLKSAFERIFEKYERDFTGVGDEIDLETGEVVVNNGHLQSLDDEKDRAREDSVSSNEEERIMRGKDPDSVQRSHSKSLAQTSSLSSHNSSLGFPVGPNQQLTTNGTNHQFLPYEMPPNQSSFTDPFMFGSPMFGNVPVDPLWKTPEIPVAVYQDRFGFIGQKMGYPPSFGYSYGAMLAPGGNLNNGPFNSLFHPHGPQRLASTKTLRRKLLLPVTPAADDSEEDDILLSNDTQKVVKSVAIKSINSSPLAKAAEKASQVGQRDAKQVAVTVKDKSITIPRRGPGRPKKVAVPAKPPRSNNETSKGQSETTGSASSTNTSNPIKSTTSSFDASVPPRPPSKEGPVLARQIATNMPQTEASPQGDSESLDSRHRRSSRGRKQTEFYGKIIWTKTRQPKLGVTDPSNVTENVTIETPNSLHLETSRSTIHIESKDSPHEESEEPEPSTEFKENSEKDAPQETDVVTLDQENHEEELPVNRVEGGESSSTESHPTVVKSEQLDPLPPTSRPNTDEIETSMEDSEVLSQNGLRQSDTLSNDQGLLCANQDLAKDTYSDQLDKQEPKPDSHIPEDTIMAEDAEIVPHSLLSEIISSVLEEAQGSNSMPNDLQGATQSLPAPIEPEDAELQLPDPVQEEDQPPEPENTEPEMRPDNAASQPSLIELNSDPPCLPIEDEAMSSPTPRATSPQTENEIPAETCELPLRPPLVQTDSSLKNVRSNSIYIAQPSSPPKSRPSSSTKPATYVSVPSTPKKRRGSGTGTEHRSGSRRTASTKKKFALTSLVPDDPDEDDDELSVLSSSVAPSPFNSNSWLNRTKTHHNIHSSPASTSHKTGRRHGSIVGSASGFRTPHRISKRTAPPATDSRTSRGSKLRFGGSGVQSSPLARTVMNLNLNHNDTTPSHRAEKRRAPADLLESSPVPTPGGTARRCGEHGFVCDRDFCFTCCK